ncbi:hypothetical protein CLOM_g14794 [Closterium sp. NIES-68]|nr:hypothetical protein CLOM_g14794 [Closterium sp. NIES-68]GJP83088.1 hypothetical protein CLOP_g13295 [Closterium sp. NIES-67]
MSALEALASPRQPPSFGTVASWRKLRIVAATVLLVVLVLMSYFGRGSASRDSETAGRRGTSGATMGAMMRGTTAQRRQLARQGLMSTGGGGGGAAASPLQKIRDWVRRFGKKRRSKRASRLGKLVADPGLGLPPPRRDVLMQREEFNPVSRYLSTGLSVDAATGAASWSVEAGDVDHRWMYGIAQSQGNCASCWATSVADAVQGAYGLFSASSSSTSFEDSSPPVYHRFMSLSTQQLVDCAGAGATCAGGYPEDGLQYVAKNKLQYNFTYLYTGAGGKCNASPQKAEAVPPIKQYEQVPLPGFLGLMLALQRQPVIVTLRASSEDFITYREGIYDNDACYNADTPANEQQPQEGTAGNLETSNPDSKYTAQALPTDYGYGDTNSSGSVGIPNGGTNPSLPEPTVTANLIDHVMLAVGYHFEGVGSEGNYFILRNSWGEQWGEMGYMRIKMGNPPFGTCGMLVQRGLYPVLADAVLPSPCEANACGGGVCVPSPAGTGKYSCLCAEPLVAAKNRDGTDTCVPVNVCGLLPSDPCGVGKCINSGDGGYSCLCPPNYAPSQLASGQTTCAPGSSPAGATYVVRGGETCKDIWTFMGLSEDLLAAQNKGLDCSNLRKGQSINVAQPASNQICRTRYTAMQEDVVSESCDYINSRFSIDAAQMNPGLDCSQLVAGQQICIAVGDVVTGAQDYELCTEYTPVVPLGTSTPPTCSELVDAYLGGSWLKLFSLNPGLRCDSLEQLTLMGQEICTRGTPLGAVPCGKGRSATVPNKAYYVRRGDTCSSIIALQFKMKSSLVSQLNLGWVCRSQGLYNGLGLCVPM